ncbi:MAG: HEAT repeat domain-containing protein [Caldilineales bacterium]
MVSLLAKGSTGERWLAAEALGEGDPGRSGVTALAAALGSDDPILRSEAGNALARIGGRTVRGALLESAAADNPNAQAAAADALGKLPADEAVVTVLQAMLDGPNAVVRQSAAEALARAGWPPRKPSEPRPDPTPRLLGLLAEDPGPMVRRAAALALGRLGDPAAEEALVACQEDRAEDWRVREAAALAVSRLHQSQAPDRIENETEEPATTPAVGEQ